MTKKTAKPTSPKRNKVLLTTTLTPALAERLNQVASETRLPKNLLIEQALLRLFDEREEKNATSVREVALG